MRKLHKYSYTITREDGTKGATVLTSEHGWFGRWFWRTWHRKTSRRIRKACMDFLFPVHVHISAPAVGTSGIHVCGDFVDLTDSTVRSDGLGLFVSRRAPVPNIQPAEFVEPPKMFKSSGLGECRPCPEKLVGSGWFGSRSRTRAITAHPDIQKSCKELRALTETFPSCSCRPGNLCEAHTGMRLADCRVRTTIRRARWFWLRPIEKRWINPREVPA